MPTVTGTVDGDGEPMACIDQPSSRENLGGSGSALRRVSLSVNPAQARGWPAARAREVSGRIVGPVTFGVGLLGVGLLASVGLGASLDTPPPTPGSVGAGYSTGLPFEARLPDAGACPGSTSD